MFQETKRWIVAYSHADGREGVVEVETVVEDSGAFKYGNGKCGMLTVGESKQVYDLRYSAEKDYHEMMIRDYFGSGLVEATETD